MAEYIVSFPDKCAGIALDHMAYYPDEIDGSLPITPFVRCRDCKHSSRWEDRTVDCDLHGFGATPDDYCSWGEREDE